MSRPALTFKEAFLSLGWIGFAAMAVIGLTALTMLIGLYKFTATIIGPRPVEVVTPSDEKKQAEQYAAAFTGHLSQIDGRSLFYIPPAPSEVAAAANEAPVEDTAAESQPSVYGGPAIIAMINDQVWFQDGKKLSPGDAASDGLEVVRLEAPWDAVVRWKGVEFTVSLFKRDAIVIKNVSDKPATTAPSSESSQPSEDSTAPKETPSDPPAPASETPQPTTPTPVPAPESAPQTSGAGR